MRVALVVNPKAGRNRGLAAADAAERVLREGGWRVTQRVTAAHGEARKLAAEAAAERFDAVLACGGDGTLSQVVQGLLDTGVPAGCVPTGTGNDFARTIGLSQKPTIAARQLLLGHQAEADLLEVNGGEHRVLNVMGVGFDARVAARTNRRTRLIGGRTAYLTAVGQELIRHQPTDVHLRVGNESWQGRALLVAVANAKCYGAGMMIAPRAEIADGLLDVVLVEYVSRLSFLRSFPKVFRGTHAEHRAVRMWQATTCSIETPEPTSVLVDGELQAQTPVHVRVASRRAKLWMPGALAPATTRLRLEPSPEA